MSITDLLAIIPTADYAYFLLAWKVISVIPTFVSAPAETAPWYLRLAYAAVNYAALNFGKAANAVPSAAPPVAPIVVPKS